MLAAARVPCGSTSRAGRRTIKGVLRSLSVKRAEWLCLVVPI